MTILAGFLFYLIIKNILAKEKIFHTINKIFFIILGFLFLSSFFIVWLWYNDAIKDFWIQSIKFTKAFSENNFSTGEGNNEFILITFIKVLLQFKFLDNKTSFIWTLLPLICVFYFFKIIINVYRSKKFDLYNDKLLLLVVISLFSWINYYPVNAIFQIHMSAATMFGVFMLFIINFLENIENKNKSYYKIFFLLTLFFVIIFLNRYWIKNNYTAPISTIASFYTIAFGILILFSIMLYSKKKITFQIIISMAVFLTFFMPDISIRVTNLGEYLKDKYYFIKSPDILSLMRVNKNDYIAYKSINEYINNYIYENPNSKIINITTSGLYPVFKKNNPNITPTQMYWGWENSFMYNDYCNKINSELIKNNNIVISNYFLIKNYVPQDFFNLIHSFEKPLAVMYPGIKTENFTS